MYFFFWQVKVTSLLDFIQHLSKKKKKKVSIREYTRLEPLICATCLNIDLPTRNCEGSDL